MGGRAVSAVVREEFVASEPLLHTFRFLPLDICGVICDLSYLIIPSIFRFWLWLAFFVVSKLPCVALRIHQIFKRTMFVLS